MTFLPRFICVVSCFLISVGLCFSSVSDCHLVVLSQQSSMEHSAGQDRTFQNGLIALKENRLEDALDAFTKAEHEHPRNARIHNFRGIVLAGLGQTTEATVEYEEAIRLDPQMEDAYRNLGFLEWTQHRFARAREVLEQALKLSSNDSFTHYYLGRVQLDAGLYSEAFRELELSGVPWPSEPDFLIQIATGHVALGKQEEARKALRQLETFPLGDSQSVHAASLFLA